MSIEAGENIEAADFINESDADPTPANNVGKVPKLEADGRVSPLFVPSPIVQLTAGETITVSSAPKPVLIGASGDLEVLSIADNNNNRTVGFSTSSRHKAQSFSFASSVTITSITVKMYKSGSPTWTGRISIQTDNAGSPSGTEVDGENYSASALTTNAAGQDYSFSVSAALSASTTYWVVVEDGGTTDSSNYVVLKINGTNPYSGGLLKTFNSGAWASEVTEDMRLILELTADPADIYEADANSSPRDDFIGFITETVAGQAAASVYVAGIVSDFSGLTPGALYYVQDTIGTIGTSPGSTSILVGRALTATSLLVLHEI